MSDRIEHRDYHTPPKYYDSYYTSTKGNRCGDWVCINCNNLNYSFRKKCNRCKTISRDHNFMTPVYSYYYYENHSMQNEDKKMKNQPLFQLPQKNITSFLEVPDKENKFQTSRTRQKDKLKNSQSNQQKCSLGISGQNVVSQFESNQETSSVQTSLKQFKTPLKNKNQNHQKNNIGTPELPSVSPLLKKYKESKDKKQKQYYNKYLSNRQKMQRSHMLFYENNSQLFNADYTSLNENLFDTGRQLQWSNLVVRDFNEYLDQKQKHQQSEVAHTDEMEKLISNIILQ